MREMKEYNLGEIIYQQRKKLNLNQQDIADELFCNRSNVSHYENGTRSVPNEFILPLSRILKFNFVQYLENAYKYENFEHYILAYELIDYTTSFSYEQLEALLHNKIIVKEFNYGSAYILREYSKAQVATYLYKDYVKAEKILLKLLNIPNRKHLDSFEPILHDEERYYSCVALLSSIYGLNDDYKKAIILLKKTIDFLEVYYTNESTPIHSVNSYFRKIHIALLNNYSDILYKQNDLNESLKACNKAINTIIRYESIYAFEFLLKLKIEVLYKLERIDESQKLYDNFKSMCILKDRLEYFHNANILFNKECPLIKTSDI